MYPKMSKVTVKELINQIKNLDLVHSFLLAQKERTRKKTRRRLINRLISKLKRMPKKLRKKLREQAKSLRDP